MFLIFVLAESSEPYTCIYYCIQQVTTIIFHGRLRQMYSKKSIEILSHSQANRAEFPGTFLCSFWMRRDSWFCISPRLKPPRSWQELIISIDRSIDRNCLDVYINCHTQIMLYKEQSRGHLIIGSTRSTDCAICQDRGAFSHVRIRPQGKDSSVGAHHIQTTHFSCMSLKTCNPREFESLLVNRQLGRYSVP
jgi:hypothetical protein